MSHMIKEEIGRMMETELADPRLGFVTVTGVKLSGDLKQAIIYFSVLGNEEAWQETLRALESARGYLKTGLARNLKLRSVPELIFKEDDTLVKGARVIELIEKEKKKRAK